MSELVQVLLNATWQIACLGVAAWAYSFLRNAPSTVGLPTVHEWKNEPTEEATEKTTWQKQKVVFQQQHQGCFDL